MKHQSVETLVILSKTYQRAFVLLQPSILSDKTLWFKSYLSNLTVNRLLLLLLYRNHLLEYKMGGSVLTTLSLF